MTNSLTNIIRNVVSNMTMPQSQNVWGNTLTLAAGIPVQYDFKSLANQNAVQNLQGIWIDNSAGTAACTVSVPASLQNFTVPIGYQGVAPLYVTPDMVLVFSGIGVVPVVFLNFPTPASVWPANTAASGSFTFTGGALNTRDAVLDPLAQTGGLLVVPNLYGNADAPIYARQGNPLSGNVTAAGTTVLLAGAPSVFLSSVDVSVDGNASLAAAGPLTVTLFFGTSATRIFQRTVILPAAAPATPTPRYELFNQSDLAFIGTIAGDNISFTLSAALTSGTVSYVLGAGTTAVF